MTTGIWSTARRGGSQPALAGVANTDTRSPFEHDYDRLLFSTPVRRMADKTQVFPLDLNDGVRTRLTHSHEVSNLARSIGNRLVRQSDCIFGDMAAKDASPIILAAVGLAHDLGNPPFGHQGENAIRDWFKKKPEVFSLNDATLLPAELQQDFLNFEGNAQTLRLLSRLQISIGGHGLDLTAATLAASMKYPIPASAVDKTKGASYKKPGFLASERQLVDWIKSTTGLSEGQRHPLTWLMEACDDIAYSALDIEDSIKKGIFSAEDVLAHFKRRSTNDFSSLAEKLDRDFTKTHEISNSSRISEIKTSYLRTRLIETMITSAAEAFIKNRKAIFEYTHNTPLLESSNLASIICKELKSFAKTNAFNHPSVLKAESEGAVAISKLMDWFWDAISKREKNELLSRRVGAFNSYVYELISPNYRYEADQSSQTSKLPMRYWELRLLTDMVAGMMDSFAINLFGELKKLSHA